jgi:hypothetical protein
MLAVKVVEMLPEAGIWTNGLMDAWKVVPRPSVMGIFTSGLIDAA